MAYTYKNGQLVYTPDTGTSAPTGVGLKAKSPDAGVSNPSNVILPKYAAPTSSLKPNESGGFTFTGSNMETGVVGPKTGQGIGMAQTASKNTSTIQKPVTPTNVSQASGTLNAPNLTGLGSGGIVTLGTGQYRKNADGTFSPIGGSISTAETPTPQAPTPGTIVGGNYNPYQPSSQMYGQLTSGLANIQDPNNPLNVAVNSANEKLRALDQEYAQQQANIEGTPGSLAMAGGQQGLLQRLFASRRAAVEGELQNALTARQQTIGAVGTAAGLAAPQAYGPTSIPYSPISGQFGQLAGNAASGGTGMFGVGQLQENMNIGAQYQQANAAANVAKGYEDTIKNYMTQNNLNPSDVGLINGVIQWLKGQVGDPKYQTLANYINEYASNAASALGMSGGNVTDFKLGIAQSLLNPRASAQSIAEVMANNNKAIQDKLANMKSTATGGGQVAGGTSGYGTQSTGGGNTFGSFFGQ